MVRPLSDESSETITIRVSPAMKKQLEQLVERGLYKSVSAATRAGLQDLIDKHKETAKED
ncbi:MAG: ribbon-helix-helix domain-containing protein [Bacteroidales bacterium]|jgi:Arc/MetJ-type ribon-helix-helix transcriptional regulator